MTIKDNTRAKIMMIGAMMIFGTIGIFRKYVLLPSGILAMSRGIIGMLFLTVFSLLKRKSISFSDVKNNFVPLCVSGILIGVNWIFLFESYKYTSVAVATLSYYMAPIFIIIASVFFLGEKLTYIKLICICMALFGMTLVSGILDNGIKNIGELKGVFFGLGSAFLYAIAVIINKKINEISSTDKTIVQLGMAGVCLIPYVVLAEDIGNIAFSAISVFTLLFMGVVHTGIAYTLYFEALKKLNAQTAAVLSYIDPAIAIILSVIILRENIGISGWVGAFLIIAAAFFSERGK